MYEEEKGLPQAPEVNLSEYTTNLLQYNLKVKVNHHILSRWILFAFFSCLVIKSIKYSPIKMKLHALSMIL
jgi:hypothetical protein